MKQSPLFHKVCLNTHHEILDRLQKQISVRKDQTRAAIFLLPHPETAQVQNGRPDGNGAPRAPTDAPTRPLGTHSLIRYNSPDYSKDSVTHALLFHIFNVPNALAYQE